MRIVTPTEIEQAAWEGTLERQGKTYRSAAPLPKITLGEPVQWSPEQALAGQTGATWTPPGGDGLCALDAGMAAARSPDLEWPAGSCTACRWR